jgi:hypothetical protein
MNTENISTDNASLTIVAQELLKCCNSWDPKARLLGNIRAEDIARICHKILEESKETKLDTAALSSFFKNKALEHGIKEVNLFIENRGTHLSLSAFTEFESYIVESKINETE